MTVNNLPARKQTTFLICQHYFVDRNKKAEKAFCKRLGAQIARVRRSRGYSQDRVYLEGGFKGRGTLSKIENGKINPKSYTLYRIAKTIGVPLKKLFDFDS